MQRGHARRCDGKIVGPWWLPFCGALRQSSQRAQLCHGFEVARVNQAIPVLDHRAIRNIAPGFYWAFVSAPRVLINVADPRIICLYPLHIINEVLLRRH
jgi:hypothetical protein